MIKNFLIIAILAVIMIGCVIYGISESGSPWDTRARKFDQTRITDINNLKYSIDSYYSNHSSLPSTLKDLSTANYSYYKDTDPETNQLYEYKTTSMTSYQLCTTFSKPSDPQNTKSYVLPTLGTGEASNHPQGYYCFDFTVSSAYTSKQIPYYGPTTASGAAQPPTSPTQY